MIPLRTRVFRKKNLPSTKPKQKKHHLFGFSRCLPCCAGNNNIPPVDFKKRSAPRKCPKILESPIRNWKMAPGDVVQGGPPSRFVIHGVMRAPKKSTKAWPDLCVFTSAPSWPWPAEKFQVLFLSTPNLSENN